MNSSWMAGWWLTVPILEFHSYRRRYHVVIYCRNFRSFGLFFFIAVCKFALCTRLWSESHGVPTMVPADECSQVANWIVPQLFLSACATSVEKMDHSTEKRHTAFFQLCSSNQTRSTLRVDLELSFLQLESCIHTPNQGRTEEADQFRKQVNCALLS